jgi:phospholipid/cholesterol/gamma-HCH transport system substrate-binding protein
MRNNKQYLIVGTFVLVGIAMIVGILLWFSASNRKAYDVYRITFSESIDGITTNSMVKYNGVVVGQVKAIELDNKDPRNIYVDINVNQGVTITTATYATIKAQGVTGMSYVALMLTPKVAFSVVPTHNSEPYPQIPAKLSFLSSLSEQAQGITDNVDDISVQIKALLNAKNLKHVENVLANLDKVSAAVASQSDSIASSIVMVGQVLGNVNDNTQHLAELSKSLQQNSASLDKVLNTVQNETLRNFNSVTLPNLNQSIGNINLATAQFNELLKTINQNPSAIVRGSAPRPAGPGE